jgi:hypothetical protein
MFALRAAPGKPAGARRAEADYFTGSRMLT